MAWHSGKVHCPTHSSPEHACPAWALSPIAHSIGAGGDNSALDVRIVQGALNRIANTDGANPRFMTDRVVPPKMFEAIRLVRLPRLRASRGGECAHSVPLDSVWHRGADLLMVSSLRRALAVVCMTLTSIAGCKSELKLQPGDEMFSILEEAVLEVSLRSPTRRADARRFRPEQPLRFSFEDEGRAGLEGCGPSPELNAALAHLLEIRVRRVLSAGQSRTFVAAHASETVDAHELALLSLHCPASR